MKLPEELGRVMIRMLADPVLLEIVRAAGGVGTQLTLEPEALHLI